MHPTIFLQDCSQGYSIWNPYTLVQYLEKFLQGVFKFQME